MVNPQNYNCGSFILHSRNDMHASRIRFLLSVSLALKKVPHLGHILSSDLSLTSYQRRNLCKKANCMRSVFSSCDPLIKTKLFQISHCMAVPYGKPHLRNLSTWRPHSRRCHTSILHLISGLHSLFNVVIDSACSRATDCNQS